MNFLILYFSKQPNTNQFWYLFNNIIEKLIFLTKENKSLFYKYKKKQKW